MTRFSARLIAPVALAIGTLGLAACSEDAIEPGTTSEDRVDDTIASIIGGNDDLSTVASALSGAGLDTVFDGPGSYTILAPTDAAFEALEGSDELLSEENRPLLIAVLRDHVVPGHLTVESITEAIEQNGGSVEMRTLGGGLATFSANDGGLSVSSGDGPLVRVAGQAEAGSNGVVIPIDGLLEAPAAAE
ncbi:fasciclin domain-containing protein [Altererythrobacter sp. MF3-039]|uniref:fasciclin domain-containing protein n=1 Tax=Altererythrobacter sp. MF3-039 TaxID=3252901 RepID=UPI00390C6F69